MKFKKGQQIACIVSKSGWYKDKTNERCDGPDKHEVVTADGYNKKGDLFLVEYPCDPADGYDDRCFVPLVSDSVLALELESVPEPFTI